MSVRSVVQQHSHTEYNIIIVMYVQVLTQNYLPPSYTFIHKHMHVHMHVPTHAHRHAHAHKHVHTHTHTHTRLILKKKITPAQIEIALCSESSEEA